MPGTVRFVAFRQINRRHFIYDPLRIAIAHSARCLGHHAQAPSRSEERANQGRFARSRHGRLHGDPKSGLSLGSIIGQNTLVARDEDHAMGL